MYEVKVRGASRSIYDSNKVIQGQASVSRKVQVQPNCDRAPTFMQTSSEELSAGMIAGLVCVICSLVLTVIGFVLWRYVQLSFKSLF